MTGIEKALRIVSVLFIFAFVFVSKSGAWSDFKTIGTAQLHSMIVDNAYALEAGRNRPFMVIDARPKEEYDEAHIASAFSIPEEDFEQLADLLPKDKGVLLVVYCDGTETGACRRWADKAETAGYVNIAFYPEGFTVWKKKEMPVAPLRGLNE